MVPVEIPQMRGRDSKSAVPATAEVEDQGLTSRLDSFTACTVSSTSKEEVYPPRSPHRRCSNKSPRFEGVTVDDNGRGRG